VPSITAEDRLRRASRVSWQDIDGETILLVLQQEKLIGLNRAAGRIWQLIDGSRTNAEVAALVAEDFDGPRERILQDTLAFAQALTARGFAEVVSP